MTIQENDIRAELSYACFHAIASRAGFACSSTVRLFDGLGVDAMVKAVEQLAPDSIHTDFTVEFQLKASSQALVFSNGKYSLQIEDHLYNKLRNTKTPFPKPLVLMILPADSETWLEHSEESLVCRKCLYWVSLRNAPATSAEKPTIHVPKLNVFNVQSLRTLMTRFSRDEAVEYGG